MMSEVETDPLAERYKDFMQQEDWLAEQIHDICDRAVSESRMTRCQVSGVLMDIALTKIGRPVHDDDEDDDEDESESWRR